MKLVEASQRRFFQLAVLVALASTLSSCARAAKPITSAAEPITPVAKPTTPATEPIRGMVGVGTWKTQAEFKDIRVTKGNQTLFASDFSKGAASLRGWKTIRGQWQAVDGVLRQTGNEEDARAVIGSLNGSDCTISLKARKIGGDEGFLILFGMPDETTRSWWNIGGWGNTQHAIQGPGIAGERVPGKIETGRWYEVKVELKGNTIRAFLDGQFIQAATQVPGTHTIVFNTRATGQKMPLTHWGLDTAWAHPDNVRRAILYMGRKQVDIVRVSFPINTPLVNGDLPASKHEHFTTRIKLAQMAGDKPWTMLPDTEAGVHPWYKNGNYVIPERWLQLIAVSQRRYGKKMESIEAFNEADYGWGQGNAQNLNDILSAMRNHAEFKGVQLGGPSTLSSGAALPWYNATKSHLDRGTTHALGGDMESYINFFKQVVADGKIADNPEPHNLAEVIAGAEYGLQSAIWWGTAELARGEFVKASDGVRLAYAEDRPRWSAAAVYRAPDGKLQAFAGCSERQGETTTYRFVSQDRPVFFNGDGPRREFSVTVRRHWENVINITWGQDVPPKVGGRYVIVNRHSGKVLGVAGANKENGAGIQQMDYRRATHQQWEVAPFVGPWGDQSYFTMRALHSGKSLDTANWNYDEGGKIQQWGEGDSGAQHWYFEYAGDNYFYIRSRHSTKCLGIAGKSKSARASVQQFSRTNDPSLQWRLVPVGAWPIEFKAPQKPTKLTAAARPSAIALRWAASREADVASYTVFRSPKSGGSYDTIARGVKGNSFIDTDVKGQTRYFYVVKAVDRCLNQSVFSAEAGATTLK